MLGFLSQCPRYMHQSCEDVCRLVFYHLLLCFGTTHIIGGYNRHIQTCAELCLGEFVTAAIQNNTDDTSKRLNPEVRRTLPSAQLRGGVPYNYTYTRTYFILV